MTWLMICATASSQQYVFHLFRQAEGLGNLSVTDMVADGKGFLWVATENGLYRFLGSNFERFGAEQGIGEIYVRSLAVGADGALWAATSQNIYRWDDHAFHRVSPVRGRIDGRNRLAVEDARHVLVVDDQKLYRLAHDGKGNLAAYAPVFSDRLTAARPELANVASVGVTEEQGGNLQVWFGCAKRLCSFEEREVGQAPRQNAEALTEWGQEQGLPEDTWDGVLLGRDGTLWAGGGEHIAALPQRAARFMDRTIPGSNPHTTYGHAPLIEDREGAVLAPTDGGIARWQGSRWKRIGRRNGLQLTGSIVGMVFDPSGDLWFAAHGNGLYDFAGYGDWEGWAQEQGLPSSVVWGVESWDRDRVFVGTDNGPARISLTSGTAAPLIAPGHWNFGEVAAMGIRKDGGLWAGTFSGQVLRIDPERGTLRETAKLPELIISAVADSAGRLIIATKHALWMGGPGSGSDPPQRVTAADKLLPQHSVVEGGCLAPDGSVWFLAGNRLLHENGGAWTLPPIDGLTNLPGMLLSMSCAADGSIWATGEQDGVWRFVPGGGRLHGSELAMPGDYRSLAPLAILVDRRGWVWLGTDLGVLAWNGQSWRHLTQESGLIWNDVDQNALLEGRDGSLWIGTSGGLSHLLHPERVFERPPIQVSISDVRRGEQEIGGGNIVLPWASLPLRIQVASPAIRNRSELVFKYRVSEFAPDWVQSRDGAAVLHSVPPGTHEFSAIACNPAMSACSNSASLRIVILPPWWRTWWMICLDAIVSFGMFAGALRLNAKQTRARSRKLEILVKERTRELEASQEKLRFQATHDELTAMLNRPGILSALSVEMDRACREGASLVVALVDLDHFKDINDEFGHLAGDEALRLFANAVRSAMRPYDHAGRYGGEEFLLILSGIPLEEVETRLIELHALISNLQVRCFKSTFQLNCSLGVAVFDPAVTSRDEQALLSAADQALYAAKESGRNRVVFSRVMANVWAKQAKMTISTALPPSI